MGRATSSHYHIKYFEERKENIIGDLNVIHESLVPKDKVILPPLHIKLGVVKNFIKSLNTQGNAFKRIQTIFPRLSAAKLKEALLAINSLRVPEVSKSFVHNHLGKIYESLCKVSPFGFLSALKCTEECLRSYPGASGPFRSCVEKFLIKFIDSPTLDLIIWSGKCMLLLQQVRGGGVQGVSHKASWLSYQQKLLGSLHIVLDLAFSKCNEIYDKSLTPNQDSRFSDLKLSDEPTKRAAQIFVRFRNLVNYLVDALRCPFPVAKPVTPKKILNLISRGLSVNISILEINPISDNLALGVFLPKMHILLLELLRTLILTLRTNLKPHHEIILGLVVDTLNWTSGKNSAGKKPLSNLRSKAYDVLSLWCTVLQNGSRIELVAETLITEVLYDAVPFQNECTLQVLSGAKKHMSKKARRQLHKAQNENSNISQSFTHDNVPNKVSSTDERDKKICASALKTLQQLLISATSFLKPTLVKMIQVRIMKICSLFYELPMKQQQLYFNWECRLEIFKVLHIFTICTHHLCPPPTEMTIHILQIAHMSDRNTIVRQACAELLRQIENIVHPCKESLIFPIDTREIRNAFLKLGQEHLLTSETPWGGYSKFICDTNNETELSNEKSMENNDSIYSLLDLTEKDSTDQKCVIEPALEPASYTDSVEIVVNSPSTAMNEDENMDFTLQSKFSLWVDDDDTEMKQSSLEITSDDRNDDALREPLTKKQRLGVNKEIIEHSLSNELDNSLNKKVGVGSESNDAILNGKTDEDMLADIEAAFVDELN